jgi:hypothetical protein
LEAFQKPFSPHEGCRAEMTQTIQCEIYSACQVFLVEDARSTLSDLTTFWTEEACIRLLAVAPDSISVGTVREGYVPVFVTLLESCPTVDPDAWDHVTMASLQLGSGQLCVTGCSDLSYPVTLDVAPGIYQAIIGYARLQTVSPDGAEGGDYYHVHLFPGHEIKPVVLKQRPDGGSGPVVGLDSRRHSPKTDDEE